MRIISGSARGLTLATPKDQRVRPTTDRVRESLFSILGNLHDLIVLDAFAGTGALGCEALSRGAAFCYFFDPSKDSITLVKENLSRVKATDRASTQQRPMTQALPTITQHTLDLVFLDPPYHTTLAHEALPNKPRAGSASKPRLLQLGQKAKKSSPGFSPTTSDARNSEDRELVEGRREGNETGATEHQLA